jgi:solute carrier family 8 (sodium/calcium exchanger)
MNEADGMYKEPKFMVFYLLLLSLFSMFCFKCRERAPAVTAFKTGTMVTLVQNCPSCGDSAFKWSSQPLVLGKYPAGNIVLSFGILMAGASVSKIFLVFKHMGMCSTKNRTFFIHQSQFIIPAILHHWEAYGKGLVQKAMEDIV